MSTSNQPRTFDLIATERQGIPAWIVGVTPEPAKPPERIRVVESILDMLERAYEKLPPRLVGARYWEVRAIRAEREADASMLTDLERLIAHTDEQRERITKPPLGDEQMGEKLFIVFGEDGEYSDWATWPVAAYRDEAMAMQHVEGAEAANRLRTELRSDEAKRVFEEWDGSRSCGSYGSCYSLNEVELRDAPPDISKLERMQDGRRRQLAL